VLELRDIHKRFRRTAVLRGLSLQLRRGEIYGLLGPNGAGKSTTLKIATGLVRPNRGDVRIDRFDLRAERARALRQVGAQIDAPAFHGHLSGRRNLLRLTILQGLPPRAGEMVLEDVALSGRGDDKVQDYSMGMKQRLAIAATLLGRPQLLILDEPTSGLDPQGRQSILDLVRKLAEDYGPTVLVTSHVFDEVTRLCDRVGILHEGTLAYEGPPETTDRLRDIYFERTGRPRWDD
jgi:ABC-type multidrug transport system ATPase subunit